MKQDRFDGGQYERQKSDSKWPAAIGGLLVLLGFVDQKLLIDRANEARQRLEAASQADQVEEYALQSPSFDVSQYTAATVASIDPQAVDKTRVLSALSAKLYLINAQRRIADDLVDALPLDHKDVIELGDKLKSQVDSEIKEYKAYQYGVSAEATDLDAVNSKIQSYTGLISESQQYNHKARALAKDQLKEETKKINLESWLQYALFGFGWLLTFVLKWQGKDSGFDVPGVG